MYVNVEALDCNVERDNVEISSLYHLHKKNILAVRSAFLKCSLAIHDLRVIVLLDS